MGDVEDALSEGYDLLAALTPPLAAPAALSLPNAGELLAPLNHRGTHTGVESFPEYRLFCTTGRSAHLARDVTRLGAVPTRRDETHEVRSTVPSSWPFVRMSSGSTVGR